MATIPVSQSGKMSVDARERPLLLDWIFRYILQPVGSLKLAVLLFALAIVVILIGTLAQVERDIWRVLEEYFKPWVIWVDVPLLFPRSWFPQREIGSISVVFAVAVAGGSLVCAGMTLFNAVAAPEAVRGRAKWQSPAVVSATGIAATVLLAGLLIAVSSLWRGGFWFPGGALIGAAMCVNLVAAHGVRFRVQARGRRLWLGLAVTAVGVILTGLIILSGHNTSGFQGEPPVAWRTLWQGVKVALSLIAGGLLVYATFAPSSQQPQQRHVRWICGGLGLILALLTTWLWATRDSSYLGDSGMRVLWQLILGLVAGAVLLLGCIPLFGRRSGTVLLHVGVALLMFGQWFVGRYDVEEQITMAEGQTRSYGQDIRSVELAVIDRQNSQRVEQENVLAIPLTRNGKSTAYLDGEQISDPQLPFEIRVVQYFSNARVMSRQQDAKYGADSGRGRQFAAVEQPGATGASGSSVDLAAGYFQFIKDGANLGTFLLSQDELMMADGTTIRFDTERIEVAGKPYDVQLRFVRNYKDYSLQLIDVRKDDYLGTSIPRNYSSRVRLRDPQRDVDQELNIWMNNPRRYAGETFYQSGWQTDMQGREYTTLQVVRNHGWMIPYVACMLCMVGMLAHFSLVLLRFLSRQTAPANGDVSALAAGDLPTGWRRWWLPAAVLIATAALLTRVAAPPHAASQELQLEKFGDLPLVYQGRVKPFDTLARNSLRVVADAESFVGVLPPQELQQQWPDIELKLKAQWPQLDSVDLSTFQNGNFLGLIALIEDKTDGDHYAISRRVQELMCRRQPAIRWLLDVICGSERARRHRVVRIYHPEVLDLFGLERRPGFRYSLEEMAANMNEFQQQVMKAEQLRQTNVAELNLYQRKLLETQQKLGTIISLYRAFNPADLPPLPTAEEFTKDHTAAMERVKAFQQAAATLQRELRAAQPPLAVPPAKRGESWEAYAAVWPRQMVGSQILGESVEKASPAFAALNTILVAYLKQDAQEFNQAVTGYQQLLQRDPPAELQEGNTASSRFVTRWFDTSCRFEAFFNHAAPFFWCSVLYLVAFVILALGWLGWRRSCNQAAFWLIALTFVVHTLALAARIYISGRPPVTNLYSSAVFIGWGVVGLALVIELFFRDGLASVIAAASGFTTLVIAHKLAGDGDTFQVLQAVLDTQFWLATHVVCITFGYATTFLAGGLGLLFILRGVFTPSLGQRTAYELGRMIYGTLCFAILFSFIGTILGGLWADDSWGRFWGWDPKENGALIIVLWNALILHARWDGMVKERGMAVLAVLGNVVTAWSWFGVNELGVGLHAYGFTEGRLVALAWAVGLHLLIVLIGWMPLALWWSHARLAPAAVLPQEPTHASQP